MCQVVSDLSVTDSCVSHCVVMCHSLCHVVSDAVGQEPPVPEPPGARGKHEEAPAEDPAEDASEPFGGEEGADREPRGSY